MKCHAGVQSRFYSGQKPPVSRELISIFAENLPIHTLASPWSFCPINLGKTRLPRIRTFPKGWICGSTKPCQIDPWLNWIGRSNDCNENGGFLGGKRWKKVENTVGESKSTRLSIWYYCFLLECVAGLVGRAAPRKVSHPLTTTSDDPWFTKLRYLPKFDGNGTGKSSRGNLSNWYNRVITE